MQVQPPNILTVGQLTRRIKDLLETEISYVWISGEISNWRVSPAGHAYFTLKDDAGQIDAVMFRGRLLQLKFGPDNGLEAIVHGLVTVYEKRGNYQIVCDEMEPKGIGALQLAFDSLKKKLEAEGLFDDARKKPLPLLPRRIGIVTSPTGAAIRDILSVIQRRFANVHILLYPARVQGDEAAEEIVEGIRVLDELGVDVMIVGRGGGSLEDLWPFNEELVVRAVHEAKTPIISAVGHEIDFTLCDFVADVRAPTPSAAAELVVQRQEDLLNAVSQSGQRLVKALARRLDQCRSRLTLAQSSYLFRRPEELVRQRRQRADDLRMRLDSEIADHLRTARMRIERAGRALGLLSPAIRVRRLGDQLAALRQRLRQIRGLAVERPRARLHPVVAKLHALSPLSILARGYALAWRLPERTLVRDAGQLASGNRLTITFGRGSAVAVVEEVTGENDG